MSASPQHDLLIVGAGPAGTAAALAALRLGLSAHIIDRSPLPRPQAGAEWLGPATMELCDELGIRPKSLGASPFQGLTIRSWDFKRQIVVQDEALSGWIVPREPFDAALLDAAKKAGADVSAEVSPLAVELRETNVCLRLSDERTVMGQILIIADGAASPTARLAGVPAADSVPEQPRCLYADFDSTEKPGLDVVIGPGRAGQLATLTRDGARMHVSMMTCRTTPSVETQFQEFCENARQTNLLPDTPLPQAVSREAPGGVALDLDSHVGKRSLLVGDAGGFVAAFSHEGLYPAMRSATIAVEVAAAALKAKLVQDALTEFETGWRTALADYLRMPNTDLGLLMPLVFNNEQMARRVARAFLLGQPF